MHGLEKVTSSVLGIRGHSRKVNRKRTKYLESGNGASDVLLIMIHDEKMDFTRTQTHTHIILLVLTSFRSLLPYCFHTFQRLILSITFFVNILLDVAS